jgi:hypothetical protein
MALFTTNKSASELKEQVRQDFKKVVGLKGEGRTEGSVALVEFGRKELRH